MDHNNWKKNITLTILSNLNPYPSIDIDMQ